MISIPKSLIDIILDAGRQLVYLNATINKGLRRYQLVPWMLPRYVLPSGGSIGGTWLAGGVRCS